MKLLPGFAAVFLFQLATAQKVVDVNKDQAPSGLNYFFVTGGQPYISVKFVNLVEGSPYFKDEWMQAALVSKDDKEYNDIRVKLDLLDNEIHYLDANDKEFIAITPIKQLTLTDDKGAKYTFVHSSIMPQTAVPVREGWYLSLVSGEAALYKYFAKSFYETKPYSSATFEQHITTSQSFLVLYNNAFLEIKKMKDAPEVLANKKKELQAWIGEKNKSGDSSDARFVELINYYNALLKTGNQ